MQNISPSSLLRFEGGGVYFAIASISALQVFFWKLFTRIYVYQIRKILHLWLQFRFLKNNQLSSDTSVPFTRKSSHHAPFTILEAFLKTFPSKFGFWQLSAKQICQAFVSPFCRICHSHCLPQFQLEIYSYLLTRVLFRYYLQNYISMRWTVFWALFSIIHLIQLLFPSLQILKIVWALLLKIHWAQ